MSVVLRSRWWISAASLALAGAEMALVRCDSSEPERVSEPEPHVSGQGCRALNGFWQRMRPSGRAGRCTRIPGCGFIGSPRNGKCLPETEVQALEAANTRVNIYAELDNDDDSLPTIKVLVRERLAAQAVDTLKDSEELAKVLAKDLVVDMLEAETSKRQLGMLLQSIFSYENTLSPTRWLVYWSIAAPSTVDSADWLVRVQRNYFLQGGAGGREYSSEQFVALAVWWTAQSWAREGAVLPQALAATSSYNCATRPLANLVSWYFTSDGMKETATSNLVWYVNDYLQNPDTKVAVKETVVSFLEKHGQGIPGGGTSAGGAGTACLGEPEDKRRGGAQDPDRAQAR